MKYIYAICLFLLVLCSFFPDPARAVSNPLNLSNNKVGIHILDPNEIEKVSGLVNAGGGDWGYVTVPLRADDRDRIKWQDFFDRCADEHIIPIVRLATTMKPYGWERPTIYDAVDFANFLNDLKWPVKNRYVVVYNEPNHAAEWGGIVDPADYGRILTDTAQIFKQRSDNFFMISAGLDAAAPNSDNHMGLYSFWQKVNINYPQALQNIDGLSSHSYPNPAFSGRPWDNYAYSISGFKQELEFARRLTGKDFPVFISETGWSDRVLTDETIASYYQQAFSSVWNDKAVVAVTPFLLLAGDGPFKTFSLLNADGSEKLQYLAIKNMQKQQGAPEKEEVQIARVLGEKADNALRYEIEEEGLDSWEFKWGRKNWRDFFEWIMLK